MKITKIIGIALSLILVLALAISITACSKDNGQDNNTPDPDPTPTPVDKDITGITFSSETHIYDGAQHTLLIKGTLPEGVSAEYTNNIGTDAGEYSASVTLSGEGYKTLSLNATLTITKADIEGVTVNDLTVTYDGTEKKIDPPTALPEGVEMTVEGNTAINAGQYTATFTLTGKNYNTKVITAILLINKADITGITLPSATYTYDEEAKSLAIVGELPEGAVVEYIGNGVSEIGNHPVSAIISGANYNTLEINSYIIITEPPRPEDQDIVGITFEGATYTYDGTEKSLAISGTLPEGVNTEYNGNGKVNAGKYTVSVVLSGEGYKTLVLEAELTINKAKITGVTLANGEFTYQPGVQNSIEITGELPDGVTVAYEGNGVTNAGKYTVTATISGDNYETVVLVAEITVNKAQISGITFENATFTYQENVEHSIKINGELPDGVTVEYTGNGVTNAGTYMITATISGDNYETLVLTATLEVKATTGGGVLTPEHPF